MPSSPIPQSDSQLLPWLENFATKLPKHAATLGLQATVVSGALKDCRYLAYCIDSFVDIRRREADEAVAYKELIKNGPPGSPAGALPAPAPLPDPAPAVEPGVLPRLRALVQVIKNNPAYHEATGLDLGLIASAAAARPSAPTLATLKSRAGEVTFQWNKSGWTGIRIQARAAGSAEWTDLGLDLFSPYADTRPLAVSNVPEIREYRACYLEKDRPTLEWSALLVITVQP